MRGGVASEDCATERWYCQNPVGDTHLSRVWFGLPKLPFSRLCCAVKMAAGSRPLSHRNVGRWRRALAMAEPLSQVPDSEPIGRWQRSPSLATLGFTSCPLFSFLPESMIVSPSVEVMPSGPWSEVPLRPAGPLFRDRQRAEDPARHAIGPASLVDTGKKRRTRSYCPCLWLRLSVEGVFPTRLRIVARERQTASRLRRAGDEPFSDDVRGCLCPGPHQGWQPAAPASVSKAGLVCAVAFGSWRALQSPIAETPPKPPCWRRCSRTRAPRSHGSDLLSGAV